MVEQQRFTSSYESVVSTALLPMDIHSWPTWVLGMAAGERPNVGDLKFLSPRKCTSLGQNVILHRCIFPSTTTSLSLENSNPLIYRKAASKNFPETIS